MSEPLLICTDLDRTLLPNGPQSESPLARERFAAVAERREVRIAYVTGRDRTLVEAAIAEYEIPPPDLVVGDVGTSVYSVAEGTWSLWQSWYDHLAAEWKVYDGKSLHALFADLPQLTPQEEHKQGRFKSSFYASTSIDVAQLKRQMSPRLEEADLSYRIIWSIDENLDIGLVDVLPEHASKLHAIRFLMRRLKYTVEKSLFAGDSGNDLNVLCSEIPAVLVANATDEVRREARSLCRSARTEAALYFAKGGFLGMNGNYSAGILEGLAHYHPRAQRWMR